MKLKVLIKKVTYILFSLLSQFLSEKKKKYIKLSDIVKFGIRHFFIKSSYLVTLSLALMTSQYRHQQ